MTERAYRLEWVNERTGRAGILLPGPLTHHEACTSLAKFTRHPWRRDRIAEIPAVPVDDESR